MKTINTYFKLNTKVEEQVEDSQLNGFRNVYSLNDILLFSGNYNNGTPEGIFTWFHENGNIWVQGSFEQGKEVGVWKYYSVDGSLELQKDHSAESSGSNG